MNEPARFLDHFDKPAVKLEDDAVLLFCCLRNEVVRLPYFFEYYRRLGVTTFFMVDNDSDDGSGEYLRDQPDVVYFHTKGSYRGSSAGRDWTQELAHHYGPGHWCLTVDVDELLVYPACELVGLRAFCDYLEAEGSTGLFCVFLDMYSDRRLSETAYVPPAPFQDVCPYFEVDTYRLDVNAAAPYLAIFGGPRWRMFWHEGAKGKGPAMRKVPLLKWGPGTRYIFSTHSHADQPLSYVTGALLHFKFFAHFTELASAEAARGDRRQDSDYAAYAAKVAEDDPMFIGPQSRVYSGSGDLVRQGILAVPQPFIEWAKEAVPASRTLTTVAFPEPAPGHGIDPSSGKFSIASIGRLWPFLNAARSVDLNLRRRLGRFSPAALCRLIAREMEAYDIRGDELIVGIGEHAWSLMADNRVALSIRRSDMSTIEIPLEPAAGVRVCPHSLVANVFRVPLPAGEGARTLASDWFQIHIELIAPSGQRVSAQLHEGRGNPDPQVRYKGACDRVTGGGVRGWVFDLEQLTFHIPLVAYLDERFLGRFQANRPRPDLKQSYPRREPDGQIGEFEVPGLGFSIQVPAGLPREGEPGRVEIRPAFSTYHLRRTPLVLSARDLEWDRQQKAWTAPTAQSAPVPVPDDGLTAEHPREPASASATDASLASASDESELPG